MGCTKCFVPQDPAFGKEEYARRATVVRENMGKAGVDLLLVTDSTNLYYLTGFDSIGPLGLECLILPLDLEPVLVINEFYEPVYHHTSGVYSTVFYSEFQDPVEVALGAVRKHAAGAKVVGVDYAWPKQMGRLAEGLKRSSPEIEVRDGFGIIESIRIVKTDQELKYMREAAKLTEIAAAAAAAILAPGCTDRELAAEASAAMFRQGGDQGPCDPIVCAAYRGGIPFCNFAGYTLKKGDSVFFELTGTVRRYVSPLMRTFSLGATDPERELAARVTSSAVDVILEVAKDGVPAKTVAEAAMEVLTEGLPDRLFHNIIGYPVGIAYPPTWVERLGNKIMTNSPLILRSGMVFHLPMSLRKRGCWAVGLSQTIVVGPEGSTPLGSTPARMEVL